MGIWALTSCTDTFSFLDNSVYKKSEQRKTITCLSNAIKYTKENEKQITFLTSRGYKWNDLKYGLSRRLTHQGKLMLQIPVIAGRLTSPDISQSLYGQANRAYVLFVFDNAGKIRYYRLTDKDWTKIERGLHRYPGSVSTFKNTEPEEYEMAAEVYERENIDF